MYRRYTTLTVIIVIQTALAIIIGGAFLSHSSAGKILPGVESAGVSLEGLNQQMAEEVLREKLDSPEKGVLVLEGEGRNWEMPMKGIGAFYDYRETAKSAYSVGRSGFFFRRLSDSLEKRAETTVIPLFLKFDSEKLKRELEKINREYSMPPRDARLVIENEKEIRLLSGADGVEMDVEETMRRIAGLQAGLAVRVAIASKPVPPRISDKDISGLTDILGECTTSFYPGSEGRSSNIDRASERLGGTLVKPGEVLSFNRTVGPVDGPGGYDKAPVIVDEKLVDDYGGGICQVSTTLYGAVLLSGLEVVERYPHSSPVKYAPPGLDATVSEGLLDFVFKNNLGSPVYIISSVNVGDGSVKIALAGKRQQNIVYRVETETKGVLPEVVMKSSPWLRKGQSNVVDEGSPGYEVTVYRVEVTVTGEERREQISDDYYPPDPKVVEMGTSSRDR